MGVTELCVGFVVCLFIIIVAILIGVIMNLITDDFDIGLGWVFSMILACVGFGVCLTYILFEKGLI